MRIHYVNQLRQLESNDAPLYDFRGNLIGEKEKSMTDSNKTRLSRIWNAVANYFGAPTGFEQFIDKPVQPLPAYLTLRHLANGR